jgi:hypothetical protein
MFTVYIIPIVKQLSVITTNHHVGMEDWVPSLSDLNQGLHSHWHFSLMLATEMLES